MVRATGRVLRGLLVVHATVLGVESEWQAFSEIQLCGRSIRLSLAHHGRKVAIVARKRRQPANGPHRIDERN